jgi:hypothetical protein
MRRSTSVAPPPLRVPRHSESATPSPPLRVRHSESATPSPPLRVCTHCTPSCDVALLPESRKEDLRLSLGGEWSCGSLWEESGAAALSGSLRREVSHGAPGGRPRPAPPRAERGGPRAPLARSAMGADAPAPPYTDAATYRDALSRFTIAQTRPPSPRQTRPPTSTRAYCYHIHAHALSSAACAFPLSYDTRPATAPLTPPCPSLLGSSSPAAREHSGGTRRRRLPSYIHNIYIYIYIYIYSVCISDGGGGIRRRGGGGGARRYLYRHMYPAQVCARRRRRRRRRYSPGGALKRPGTATRRAAYGRNRTATARAYTAGNRPGPGSRSGPGPGLRLGPATPRGPGPRRPGRPPAA